MSPGQDSGQAGRFDWRAYVDWLVTSRGTLTNVAEALAAERRHSESIESIERGLRRLRNREHGDGGVWGRRVTAAFGMPKGVMDRVRWMGVYHSRFTDLPVPVALDLLRLWNRPPVRDTPAGAFVDLGLAGVALRSERPDEADLHLARVGRTAPIDARIEHALVRSFRLSRSNDGASLAALDEAAVLLEDAAIDADSLACFRARLVDQRAWRHNRGRGGPVDHEAALVLYEGLAADGPPFARCRRHNGLGWTLHKLGRSDEARAFARRAVEEAGDTGMLRLRAMALRLLGVVGDPNEARGARERSVAIAERLEDRLLQERFTVR